jgi:hypothetical protein
MAFPATKDTFVGQANGPGGTVADANFINSITNLLHSMQDYYGLSSDIQGAVTHEGRIKQLEATSITATFTSSTPSSPTENDFWVDTTSATPRPLRVHNGSSFILVGANALQVYGRDVDSASTPAEGQALVWDATNSKIKWATVTTTGALIDPTTTMGDMIYRASGGTTRLGIGSAGHVLQVVSGSPAWAAPNFVAIPSGSQQGDVLYFNGTVWTRLGPGTAGQFLKTQGASANPGWFDLPSSPPGSAIASPVGSTTGDVLVHNGTDWVRLPAGTVGQFLKTNGTASAASWATPATSGFANPMTAVGQIIVATTGGSAIALSPGANGSVLRISGGAPVWSVDIVDLTTAQTLTTKTLTDPIIARLRGGATSFIVRNNANTLDNFTVTDAGLIVARGSITSGGDAIAAGASRLLVAMATPGAPTLNAFTSGGTLATATYYYKIVAVDVDGNTSAAGVEANVAVTGPNGRVELTWTAIGGAASYRIYRGTSTNGQNVYYTSTSAAYSDTNAASTGGTPPATNTAYAVKWGAIGTSWTAGPFEMWGGTSPGVSSAGAGRIYFDRTSGKFKASQNGAAYVDLVGGGGGGGTGFEVMTGGNTFGTLMVVGTNDNFGLSIEINGSEVALWDTTGFLGLGNTPGTRLDVSGALTVRGMAAPSTAPSGQGRIYFDSGENKFKVSQSTGAYVDLVGTSSSGGVTAQRWLIGQGY